MLSNKTNPTPSLARYPSLYPSAHQQSQNRGDHPRRDEHDCGEKECEQKVCDDPENEVYQECGSKCVLGCRYATTSAGITISKHDCEKNDCVEGCFCKTGLVRHQNKCIEAQECPVRKCNHRYEVYMCGPAAPITCDNALRGSEIVELTKHVDCVWGCYCAQGYLRNNYNGKCVSENECRNTKSVDISPQIPGLFKHIYGCPNGGCSNSGSNSGDGCGSKGCASNHESSEEDDDDSKENNENSGPWPFNPAGAQILPGIPVWGALPGFSGAVTHYHHFNDTGLGLVGSVGSGGNITGNCIGKYACTGGPPSTSLTLQNGTTVNIPVLPGSSIDVTAGGISAGSNPEEIEVEEPEKDEEEQQNNEDKLDEVEEETDDTEMQNNDKQAQVPVAPKPNTPNNGFPNQFINPFYQFQGINPNFAQNGYPNAPQFPGFFNAPPQSQFVPQNYFVQSPVQSKPGRHPAGGAPTPMKVPERTSLENTPPFKVPERIAFEKSPLIKMPDRVSTEKESEANQEKTENESQEQDSEEEDQPNASNPNVQNSIQSATPMPNIPTKNTLNADTSNRVPSNYPPQYFSYFNQFNPNQYNLNAANRPGYPQQYIASNPQFNQFNPYNFQQPANLYGNAQLNGFPNQGAVISNNRKPSNKNRPQGTGIQPTPVNGFKFSYNKKARPYKEPVNQPDTDSSDENATNT